VADLLSRAAESDELYAAVQAAISKVEGKADGKGSSSGKQCGEGQRDRGESVDRQRTSS
jgi:hypothetical protein